MAHRLAWLYVHGEWPQREIDHKDNVRHHNWIGNLRDVSHSVNMQNQVKHLDGYQSHEVAMALYLKTRRPTHCGTEL